jgi:hypothetical protein
MKKSRLLEIIREEISGALNEIGLFTLKDPTDAKKGLAQTLDPDDATEKSSDFLKKYKKVSEAELEEDQLNEIPDFGGRYDQQVAAKYGEEDTLQTAANEIVDRVLMDRGLTKADVTKLEKEDLKSLLKDIRQQISGKQQDIRVKHALEKQTEFDDSGSKLQDNQTNNAILKALGLVTPGKKGRKASEKPAEAPKAKTEKAPKAKVATRTPGDDGFDDVSYSEEDDEVAAATKAISGDETAKELGSTPEEKKVKFNQFLASVKKNKDDKAKIEGILKLAKEKFKFPKTMMDDLKRAAGRDVEA